jgi:hypothetical protein
MMGSWKTDRPRQLRKVAYALTKSTLNKVIEDHENRGWTKASEVKPHGYGLGCLMIWNKRSE